MTKIAHDPDYAVIFMGMLAKLDARMAALGDVPEHDSAAILARLAA